MSTEQAKAEPVSRIDVPGHWAGETIKIDPAEAKSLGYDGGVARLIDGEWVITETFSYDDGARHLPVHRATLMTVQATYGSDGHSLWIEHPCGARTNAFTLPDPDGTLTAGEVQLIHLQNCPTCQQFSTKDLPA